MSSCLKGGSDKDPESAVIIAYVGGYNGLVDANKISPNKITHINYVIDDVLK